MCFLRTDASLQHLTSMRVPCCLCAGNDCFFRNPTNIDENLFVDFSSPSSSKYRAVTDLGTPDMAAQEVCATHTHTQREARHGKRKQASRHAPIHASSARAPHRLLGVQQP